MSDHKSRARTINNGIIKLWKIIRRRDASEREKWCNWKILSDHAEHGVESGMRSVNNVKRRKSTWNGLTTLEAFLIYRPSHFFHLTIHLTLIIYYQFNAPFVNDNKNSLRLLKPVNFTSTFDSGDFFSSFVICRQGKRENLIYFWSFMLRQESERERKTLIERMNWFQLLWD